MAVLVLVASPAAAQAPYRPSSAERSLAERIRGCYEIVQGEWQSGAVPDGLSAFPKGRIRFELSDRPIRTELATFDRRAYFRVRRVSVDGKATSMFTSWQMYGGSPPSIFVAVPLDPGGYSLELHPQGRNLAGTFSTSTDAVRPGGTASVSRPIRVVRVACASHE